MIYVVTLCFNRTAMMKASLERFEETFGLHRHDYTHIFVDQHYPKDREQTILWLSEIAKEEQNVVLDPGKNLGLAAGFNYALSHIKNLKDHIIFAYDPDMFPVTKGWGEAMMNIFLDQRFWWLSCWNSHTERETTERGFVDLNIGIHSVRKTDAAVLNSVCALKGEFLEAIGGAHEPNPYYGGFEISMYQKLIQHGKFWGFLKNFKEEACPDESLIDIDYRDYKWHTCHGKDRGNQKEFSVWLQENGKV